MSPELARWITPAILILGFLYLDRSIRSVRSDSRAGIRDLRDRMDRQVGDLRNHLDHQIGDLRDRMGRIEGTLDVLRDFFVRKGRGTAA